MPARRKDVKKADTDAKQGDEKNLQNQDAQKKEHNGSTAAFAMEETMARIYAKIESAQKKAVVGFGAQKEQQDKQEDKMDEIMEREDENHVQDEDEDYQM